ncbi:MULTISPECIES: TonB-dependent receptor [Chryseobacterium]|uniref:TonB-dependent receptor n=1 Tax=Chryseobacterium TaxID=59732 RepID=UPI0027D78206|nr:MULTISPECIES: TonB-dependent receptor [Chryseobacterium]
MNKTTTLREKYYTIIILLLSQMIAGQMKVSAKVRDSDTHLPLEAVSIILTKKNDTLVVRKLTSDKSGHFVLTGVSAGRYQLHFKKQGYKELKSNIEIQSSGLDLPDVYLSLKETVIDEVKLKPISVKIHSDTLQYNATQYKTRPDARTEDLLRRLPGIFVDHDSNVLIRGKEVEQILVNGEAFFGDDKKRAIQMIPAKLIDNIQVYSSAKKENGQGSIQDETKITTINIITKKNKSLFGDVQAGAGLVKCHNLSGNISTLDKKANYSIVAQDDNAGLTGIGTHKMPSGNSPRTVQKRLAGINISYSKSPALRFYGSTEIDDTKSFSRESSRLQTQLPGNVIQYNSTETSSSLHNTSLRFNYTLNARIDSLTTLNVNTNILTGRTLTQQNSLSHIIQNQLPINTIHNTVSSKQRTGSGYLNAYISRKFRKKGRSISVGWYGGINHLQQNDTIRVFSMDNPASTQMNIGENRSTSVSVSANYTEPVHPYGSMTVSYSLSKAYNTNRRNIFQEYPGFSSVFLETKTTTLTQQAQTRYTYQRDRYEISGGLNLQQTELDTRSDHTTKSIQFSPDLSFTYKPNTVRSFILNYRNTITPPAGILLQPIIDNTNPLFIRYGNRDLKPSLTHFLDFSYNTVNSNSQPFLINLNAVLYQNEIVEQVTADTAGFQSTKPMNFSGNYLLSFNISKSAEIKQSEINMNFNTNVMYRYSGNVINGVENHTKISTIRETIAASKTFGESLDINFNFQPSLIISTNTLNASKTSFFTYTTGLDLSWSNEAWKLTGYGSHSYYGRFNTSRSRSFFMANLFIERKISKLRPLYLHLAYYNITNSKDYINRIISGNTLLDSAKEMMPSYLMLGVKWSILKNN